MFATFEENSFAPPEIVSDEQSGPLFATFGKEIPLPRYMGNKRHLTSGLLQLLAPHQKTNPSIVDMGAGSSAIGRALRRNGWTVHGVDIASYTAPWNAYALTATQNELLDEIARYQREHNTTDIVQWWNHLLSSIPPAPAYFAKYYSPSNVSSRKYFTQPVAQWLDRALYLHTRHDWSSYPLLHAHFCGEVLRLMINAANCTGTLKSFHTEWGGPSGHRWEELNRVPRIEPLWLPTGPKGSFSSTELPAQADVIMFDPPSSVHQYASCYHLLSAFMAGSYAQPIDDNNTHGAKAGILPGQHSSPFSKRATVRAAFDAWTKTVQERAPTLVVLYPSNGLLAPMEIGTILQQHGRNTVTRIPVQDTFAYIVKTERWQTPAQLKKQCAGTRPAPALWPVYCDPERLPYTYSVHSSGSKWSVRDASGVPIALINRRYKIQWLVPENERLRKDWDLCALSSLDRFNKYLINKQWLAAWTCLRQTPVSSNHYREQWTMLHHLARACGAHRIVARMEKVPPCAP